MAKIESVFEDFENARPDNNAKEWSSMSDRGHEQYYAS
jgi:hypothetical protein